MEKILSEIDKLPLTELIQLKTNIKKKIEKHKLNKQQQEILDDINEVGYHCSTVLFNIPNVDFITLPYYIEVRCHDKEHKSDARIMAKHSDQDEWVKLLDFEYEPSQDEVWEDLEEWNYGDWDDAATGRGKI